MMMVTFGVLRRCGGDQRERKAKSMRLSRAFLTDILVSPAVLLLRPTAGNSLNLTARSGELALGRIAAAAILKLKNYSLLHGYVMPSYTGQIACSLCRGPTRRTNGIKRSISAPLPSECSFDYAPPAGQAREHYAKRV